MPRRKPPMPGRAQAACGKPGRREQLRRPYCPGPRSTLVCGAPREDKTTRLEARRRPPPRTRYCPPPACSSASTCRSHLGAQEPYGLRGGGIGVRLGPDFRCNVSVVADIGQDGEDLSERHVPPAWREPVAVRH